jgi:hypothetical protein
MTRLFFWVVMPCRLSPSSASQPIKTNSPEDGDYVSPKRWSLPTSSHGVTTQKNNIVTTQKNNIVTTQKNNIVTTQKNNTVTTQKNNIVTTQKNNIVTLDRAYAVYYDPNIKLKKA